MWRVPATWGAAGVLLAALLASGAKDPEDFTELFNGKDLTGWVYPGYRDSLNGKTETPDHRFQVVDGVLVANEGRGVKELATARDFNGNFRLRLEFRASPRSDSGVYLRGKVFEVRDYPNLGPYKNVKSFRDGGWNDLHFTVTNGVAVTTVNGRPLADRDELELTVKKGRPEATLNGKAVEISSVQVNVGAAALCTCNDEVLERSFSVPTRGPLGLQAEVGKFEFRHIRIQELP